MTIDIKQPAPDRRVSSGRDDGSADSTVSSAMHHPDMRIESSILFGARREILIAHGDETYRLRITSQNKLILTK